MIGYVTMGVRELAPAAAFYDALLAEVGAKRGLQTERFIFWSVKPGQPSLAIILPYDGAPATCGNGTMVALHADSPEMVDRVHRRAIELGAADEGAPGPRMGIYIGYFRDLDGNKLNAFCLPR